MGAQALAWRCCCKSTSVIIELSLNVSVSEGSSSSVQITACIGIISTLHLDLINTQVSVTQYHIKIVHEGAIRKLDLVASLDMESYDEVILRVRECLIRYRLHLRSEVGSMKQNMHLEPFVACHA